MRASSAITRGKRVVFVGAIVVAALISGDVLRTEAAGEKAAETEMDKLCSTDARVRDEGVAAVLAGRKATIARLIALFDPDRTPPQSPETRAVAAYLLGEYRAVEAVPVLARSFALDAGPRFDFSGSRYGAPVWTALVKIGPPAAPAMIDNLRDSDDPAVRHYSLDVLLRVLGGKRHLVEALEKAKADTTDPAKAARAEQACKRAREYYKDIESNIAFPY